jgi:hypothetical protein
MTIITNEPAVAAVSTDMSPFERQADTFIVWNVEYQYTTSPSRPRTVLDEKRAFASMLPMLYSRHRGQWVAISDGQVVVHGEDRKDVTRRFFAHRTRGPVYIGFVGPARTLQQATPFRARPRD